jgi:outer membrane protein, multidrug efflux system
MNISKYLLYCCFFLYSSCATDTAAIDQSAVIKVSALTASSDGYFKTHWWREFNSQELNDIITRALDHNFALQGARAKIEKARSLALEYKAEMFPTLDITLTREVTLESGAQTAASSIFVASPAITLDLWGNNFAKYKYYDNLAIAKQYEAKYAAMTVIYEIISNWVNIVYLNKKNIILQQNLRAYNELYKLQEHKFNNGNGALDALLEVPEYIYLHESEILKNEAEIAVRKYEIALLTGRSPAKKIDLVASNFPNIIALPDKGLSAQLLQDRPDIMAAMSLLRSAKWGEKHEKTNMLPTLTLSPDITSTIIALGMQDWVKSFTGAVSYNIYNGGSDLAAIKSSEALSDQYLASYIETILTAIKEVKQDLINEQTTNTNIASLTPILEQKRLDLTSSETRFMYGDVSYLVVLDKMLAKQKLEISMLDESRDLSLYRIKLYHDLGGNIWSKANYVEK